ncbi:MAG: hypothetical protein JWM21_1927 [Acidobacteria bacterium]|nr:hypothetical protein [Acidobacteriota bacterium]
MNKSGRFLTIISISLALLLLIIVRVELKTQAAPAGRAAALLLSNTARIANTRSRWLSQQPAQKEKTIGETQKNIKVLNDMPASQLIPMMNLMSGSLGVKCTFCHVNKDGQWDFPADDKPEKNTAREMIVMTLNINKATFKGNTDVSCFTCHRGSNRPVGVMPLPVPEPTARPAGVGPGAAGAAQPTADDILNKYTTAIGGQAAIDKLKTRTMKGTYTLANGANGTYEVTQTAPDRFYVARGSQQGLAEQGFNGSAGWNKDGRGVTDIRPDQLTDLKVEYQFFRDLRLKEQYTRVNLRRDKLDGRDVYVITGVRPDKKRERLYFDAETGLLRRRLGYIETPLGMLPDQTDYEDYREVDGVKVPFTVTVAVVGGFSTATRKFTEIKFNVPVDDSRFARPAVPAAKP